MYKIGIVKTVENKIITISCGKPEQCANCKASSLFCSAKSNEFKALNNSNLEIKPGDSVEIFLPPSRTIFFSFSILIFPLLMFFAGYFGSSIFTSAASERIKLACGFIALAFGFSTAFLYNFLTKEKNYPIVMQKTE